MPTYISHSRKYYRRFYRLVVCAVILMMAVLTGSLSLGDSVRGTLVQRVNERLGRTETVITSGTGFMSEALTQHPLMSHAMGVLLMDGFVSIDDKLLPVYVWGTDADSLSSGEVMVNETLRKKLGSQQDVVLHLPSRHLIPSGSLFVTKSYATQMRVHVAGVKSVEEGGNWLLKNEQTLPLNVFINRQDLAEKMELDGRINLVLSSDVINEEQLAACWSPELSGIHVTDSSLTSDAVFIPQNIVAKTSSLTPQLYLSYFVNALIHATDTLFYSFVTAVNEWQGEPLDGKDIILSDYAAGRLHVHEGDSVSMSYFMTKHLKNLDTRAQTLKVKRIVPLSSFRSDSLLLANFPGLTHVEKCTDWDSDLPINMNKVQKEDEDFWHDYRQTPKAIVSYEALCPDWSNTFGNATAIRFAKSNVTDSTSHLSVILTPGDAGIQLYHPRAQGLSSAKGGVDFAGLFLSLGFFIILAAILLMKNPLMEMFILRQREIQLYQQLGFKDKDIRKGLFYEAFGVMLFSSPLGVVAGLAYSGLTLWLLGNVWSGATHTEGFALHITPLTLIIGWVIGMLVCAATLYLVLRSQLRALQATSHLSPLTSHLSPPHLLFLLTIVLTTLNFICFHSMVLFIVCGLLWILTWGLYLRVFISSRPSSHTSQLSHLTITWQTIHASMKQHLLAYWTLAIGVFMVFAVGLNRPDFSQFDEATGGYQVYVDSRVPIQYDLNNPAVRRKLSLHSLPDSTWFLSFLRHTQDEASCLNLHQVSTPTVLGIDLKDMEPFGLTVTPHLTPLTLHLYIDQESLMWSLMKSVGDTLFYQDWSGERVPVVIAGTYPTGVFHGNAMMSQEDFRRLWPNESGVEVLLMKSPHPDEAAEILSMAMNEYGLNIQTTDERIRMFFEVTETYLVIFLTLGGLGLLLGIFSLMIIVRKNLSAEMPVIQQYRAMGFPERLIRNLLLRENLLVPFYAVCIGAVGSVISISANVGGAGLSTLLLAFTALVAICLLLYFGIKIMVMQTLNNQQKI
ncbi:MAG: ABC transporter permease [Bacteroidaceae bacterium]|nr:ABC transporter permease [Bacteroidaceae bacterium]